MSREEGFPIEPLFDRVFVRKDEAQQTASGFHLPETIKGRAPTGTVVATGPGRFSVEHNKYIPMELKVGDRVFVKQFDGYTVKYGKHHVHVFSEPEIIGRIVAEEVEELSGGENNVGA
jgi:chaperonin GroES